MVQKEAIKKQSWELIGQVTLLGLAIIAFAMTSQIDMQFASDLEIVAGPRRYPRIILTIFIVMNLILIASTLVKAKKGEAHQATEPAENSVPAGKARAAAVFVCLVVFVLAFDSVGYLILTVPLLMFVAWMNGARLSIQMVVVSVGLTITCLILFRYGLNIVLPEGLLGIDAIF